MKSSRRYVSILAVLFAISISLAFISGCSQNAVAPVQDNPNQPQLANVKDGFTTFTTQDIVVNTVWDTVLTMQVDASGGKVGLEHAGDVISFEAKSKALSQPTLLTIRCHWSAMDRLAWTFDCGPEGTVFAVPLQLSAKKKDGSTYKTLYYFDKSKGAWILQESIDGVKKLYFDIYHFSKYGISR